jgi:chromosome segregation ATPase
MPEAESAVEENLEAQAQEPAVTDGNAPGQENAPATTNLILGKFKTSDDLAKSYSEVEKEKGRLADEIGRLRSEMEQVKSQNELAKAVAAIAESRKPKEEQPAANLDEFLTELEADGVSKTAAKKMLGLSNNWLSATEKKLRDELKSELDSTRRELDELRRVSEENMERLAPEYQQNKAIIDRMVSGGMKLSEAKKLVKELSEADSSAPVRLERATPPSSVTPTKVIAKAQTPAHNVYLLTLDDVRAARPDLDEERLKAEVAKLNAVRLERIKAGQDQKDSIWKRSAIA